MNKVTVTLTAEEALALLLAQDDFNARTPGLHEGPRYSAREKLYAAIRPHAGTPLFDIESHPSEDLLDAFVLHRLVGQELIAVEQHLQICGSCQQKIETLDSRGTARHLRSSRIGPQDLTLGISEDMDPDSADE